MYKVNIIISVVEGLVKGVHMTEKELNQLHYLNIEISHLKQEIQKLESICKNFSIYAQAERNDKKGIVPDKMQLEFTQRYVYGRCFKKETWSEYVHRHKLDM